MMPEQSMPIEYGLTSLFGPKSLHDLPPPLGLGFVQYRILSCVPQVHSPNKDHGVYLPPTS